ncbi:TenA family protein [Actibacterium sp. 188UL27-1]|uniref:TenA family protein n=1 Tax=Actibacterium sp. 188UL27-1 TaxID=2786961 RepID=UPI0019573E35|nr:TenA family protein [Actibacterium sp. 188UL27-1]MBM7068672.1 TenA family protein [Actibacterium sp. 188UL27-1]
MSTTEHLRTQFLTDWTAATTHDFCRDLADGTLSTDVMAAYLIQDYKFLDQFVRLLASAIAHVPTLKDGIPAAQFLAVVTGPENTYFQRSFEALGVPNDGQDVPARPATIAFQDLMQTARLSQSYPRMLAVLVVAEWSYLSWAEQFTDYDPNLPFWFAEWIDLHTGTGFEQVVGYLRDQLDTIWTCLDDAEKAEVTEIFGKAVRCERDFFDEAYSTTAI